MRKGHEMILIKSYDNIQGRMQNITIRNQNETLPREAHQGK